jgi:2-hydroxychromene-2-carboxylate isomerase
MVEAALGGVPDAPVPAGELAPVDLWFDYSSPFAYLALAQAEAMFGAAARWRPLLLGGLFRSVGTPDVPLFTMSPEKRRHTMQDLQRQASRADVPFAWPTRFPISTVLALRVTLQAGLADSIAGRALIVRIARALWAEDRDISDPVVLAGLCDELGFPGAQLVAAASEAKSALFAATTAAEAVGVFGVPTFVVHLPGREDLLYWGVDRMAWAARAAAGDAVVM